MIFKVVVALTVCCVAAIYADCNGCPNGASCVNVGSTYTTSDCATYKCTAVNSTNIESLGCNINGACQADGYTYQESTCVRKKCQVTQTPTQWEAATVIDYFGCNVNGNCKNNGDTWAENCYTKKCTAAGNSAGVSITEAKCKSSNGKCYGNNDGPFPYNISGNTYNCNCNATQNGNSWVVQFFGCSA